MFHSPCCISIPSPAPAALALLMHSTVSEEQRVSRTNAPPPAHHPQTSPSYQTFVPDLSELLPFGQQNTEPTFFGLLTIDPSLQSEPINDLPPAADPQPGVCLCILSNTTNRPLCESTYWCAIAVDVCIHLYAYDRICMHTSV